MFLGVFPESGSPCGSFAYCSCHGLPVATCDGLIRVGSGSGPPDSSLKAATWPRTSKASRCFKKAPDELETS